MRATILKIGNRRIQTISWILIFALVLITIILRIPMLFYGMPFDLGDEDENGFVGCALNYGASKNLKPILTYYPAFYTYILTAGIGIYYIASLVLGDIDNSVDFAVKYLMYPGKFHFVGRLLSIVFTCASLMFIFLCGLKLRDWRVGIIAAILFTFSITVLVRTSWALPDSTYLLLTVLTIYCVIRFYEGKRSTDIILGGIFCGLAISTKYNVGTLVMVGLGGIVLALWSSDFGVLRNIKEIIRKKPIYFFTVFVLAGFLLGSPYWVFDIKANMAGLKWEIGRLTIEQSGSSFFLSRIPYIWIFSEIFIRETGIGFLVIFGFVVAIIQSFRGKLEYLLFLPYLILTVILIGKYQKHSIHYLLPAFPAFFLTAAFVVTDIIIKYKKIFILSVAGIIIAVSLSSDKLLEYRSYFSRIDTRLAARNWILSNVENGATVAIGRTINSPPLPDAKRFGKGFYSMISEQVLAERLSSKIKNKYYEKIEKQSYALFNYIVKRKEGRLGSYEKMLEDFDVVSLEAMEKLGVEYVIISSFDEEYLRKNGYLDMEEVYKHSRIELVAIFKPDNFQFSGPIIRVYSIYS